MNPLEWEQYNKHNNADNVLNFERLQKLQNYQDKIVKLLKQIANSLPNLQINKGNEQSLIPMFKVIKKFNKYHTNYNKNQ